MAIPRLVATLTSAKVEPSFHHAALLGLAVDVSLRLKVTAGTDKIYIEGCKVSVYSRLTIVWSR